MIQRHKILLTLTGKTSTVNSNLQNVNGYEVNNIQGLGGGIVNPSNVRVFLNDDVNENIINDFFSYLTGSTTTIEFAEIYNSDQKLSDVFNNYYNSSILSNQFPSTSVLDQSLVGTSGITIIENQIYNFDGFSPSKGLNKIPVSINDSTRQLKISSALTTYTVDPSYYVPVFVTRNYSQMDREKLYFDKISSIVSAFTVNTGTTSVNPEVTTFTSYEAYEYSTTNNGATPSTSTPLSGKESNNVTFTDPVSTGTTSGTTTVLVAKAK